MHACMSGRPIFLYSHAINTYYHMYLHSLLWQTFGVWTITRSVNGIDCFVQCGHVLESQKICYDIDWIHPMIHSMLIQYSLPHFWCFTKKEKGRNIFRGLYCNLSFWSLLQCSTVLLTDTVIHTKLKAAFLSMVFWKALHFNLLACSTAFAKLPVVDIE